MRLFNNSDKAIVDLVRDRLQCEVAVLQKSFQNNNGVMGVHQQSWTHVSASLAMCRAYGKYRRDIQAL